ncbi:MAG: PQQ-binding-like beta-propeller repeat protein [Chloroflexia bacterium]
MQRSKPIETTSVAISLLVLLSMASGCSTPAGSGLGPAIIPTPWPTPTQVSAPQPNSNGAMVRANVHGTGVYVTKGVRQLTGLKWEFKTGDIRSITTPAIQGSTVYFGHDGDVYAVDITTGAEKWSRELPDTQSTSAPAVAGDTVYVGGREELYAMTTATGGVRWIFQPEKGSDDSYYIDPVVDGGTVYFGGWRNFYALDSETGKEKWKVKLNGVTRSVPTVYDGTVYIGTFSPDIDRATDLYALDSKTGKEKWRLKATGGGIAGAVAVTDGVVYVSTYEEGVLALDARSGQEKWRYNPGSGIATAPAVAYGTVYVTNQGTLYAVDAQTGKEKWRLQADGDFYSDPVIADGIIYFGSTSGDILTVLVGGHLTGYLHAVDAHNGQELWKYSATGSTSGAPAVSDGTVYFGSEVGTLYAVK